MKAVFIGGDSHVADLVGLSIRLRWPSVTPSVAHNYSMGLELVERTSPDVVLLQADSPDMPLLSMIQQLRAFSNVPLLVLGQSEDETEVIAALEMGADHYIKLPFDVTEMMARIWAIMRRVAGKTYHEGEMPVRSGELFINPSTYQVYLGNREVMLTSTEFRVLYLLINQRGSVVSQHTVERTLWGEEADNSGLVKKYVQRVRKKLGDSAQNPSWISNVHGVGYRFMGPRGLAGKPLAGFRATPDRRIIVLYGMIVSVIRFNNPLLHR